MIEKNKSAVDNVINKNESFKDYLDNLVDEYKSDDRIDGLYIYESSEKYFEAVALYNKIDDEMTKFVPYGIYYADCVIKTGNRLHVSFESFNEDYLMECGNIENSKILIDKNGNLNQLKKKLSKEKQKINIKRR